MAQRYARLEEALRILQSLPAFLYFDPERGIDVWSPGVQVPITVRRSVVKHRKLLLSMMETGDVRVCPARQLHAPFYRYDGLGRYTCEACQQLAM
jgi:hypothetical protein